MVAGRVSYKCYLRSTFAHADSGGFEKPPLRKHKRCGQPRWTDEKTENDIDFNAIKLFDCGQI